MKLTHNASAWAARLGMAVLAVATPLGAQNLVTNGGFETGDFTGWAHTGDLSASGVVTGCAHSGTYCALLGPVYSHGLLTQSLGTVAGHTYDVSFWLAHNSTASAPPDRYFTASWGGVPFYTYLGTGAFPYTQFGSLLAASGSSTDLQFEFMEVRSFWELDDIVVTDLSAVPEPTSVVLLGTGLVGLAGLVRRRRTTL